jgi:hypothetical protein
MPHRIVLRSGAVADARPRSALVTVVVVVTAPEAGDLHTVAFLIKLVE